jgi:hypothetical protein
MKRVGLGIAISIAVGSFVLAGCASEPTGATKGSGGRPSSAAVALRAAGHRIVEANYSVLPRTVDSATNTALLSSMCTSTRASYGISVAATAVNSALTTSETPSGSAAISASLQTIDPGELYTTTTITAYPAIVTYKNGAIANSAIGAVVNKPLWIVTYSGVHIPFNSAYSANGAASTAFATSAMDYVDPVTGSIAFTTFCL